MRRSSACLGERGDGLKCAAMTAAEIVALLQKLPPEERAEVRRYLERETGRTRVEETAANYGAGERELRYMPLGEAEKIAEAVFARHAELFRKLAQ